MFRSFRGQRSSRLVMLRSLGGQRSSRLEMLRFVWRPTKLAPRDASLVWRPTKLAHRDVSLAWRPTKLAPRDASLAWRPTKLAPRDASLVWRPTKLAPRDAWLTSSAPKLAPRDPSLAIDPVSRTRSSPLFVVDGATGRGAKVDTLLAISAILDGKLPGEGPTDWGLFVDLTNGQRARTTTASRRHRNSRRYSKSYFLLARLDLRSAAIAGVTNPLVAVLLPAHADAVLERDVLRIPSRVDSLILPSLGGLHLVDAR